MRIHGLVIGVLLLICATNSFAQQENRKGSGSYRLEYQFIRTGPFDSSIGDLDIGKTDAHTFMLSVDYALTDRLTVSASLPWIKKRHQGNLPHDPVLDLTAFDAPDKSLIDDGNYHSDWQDIYVGTSYRAKDGPLSLAPFIAFGVPTNDYPFYGHAAVGRNIWHVPVGVAWSYTPHFSDFFFSGDAAYVFTEKSLGVNINHWLVNLQLSYYLKPNFAPKVFLNIKHGTEGLDFPNDFDVTALNNEAWYFHDRTIKHNFVNGGLGFDWLVNEQYQLSATWLTMLDPDQVNTVVFGYGFSITRFF